MPICPITTQQFEVTPFEKRILDHLGLPEPTLCIDERHKRRLAHRNERTIYQRKCDATGKNMISIYHPDSPLTVYSQEYWWSDKWNAKDYGQDFDFNRPFFEQFYELQLKVPHIGLLNTRAVNSEYCNNTTDNKNCYLVFGGDYNEDCMYSGFNFYSKDVVDCYWVYKCELCYECIDCNNCYNTHFSQDSDNCRDSYFLFDCRNCEYCFGCVNLRGKKYHIFNKPYSKEEYKEKIKQINLKSHEVINQIKKQFDDFKLTKPHRPNFILNCENSSGNHLQNCKNVQNSFDLFNSEDLKDCILGGDVKDSFSVNHFGHGAELFYECSSSVSGSSNALSAYVWDTSFALYSSILTNCQNCFGCTNMNRAEYCILNKQYTKEEYEAMIPRIREHMIKTGEWGEFFPIKYSLFGYNETIAYEWFPVTEEEAKSKEFNWRPKDHKEYLPPSGEVLGCARTGKNYKLIPQEKLFYQKLGLPEPILCPEERHNDRMSMRNPYKLFDRTCAKTGTPIKTSYAPDGPEIVYSEEAFMQEVY